MLIIKTLTERKKRIQAFLFLTFCFIVCVFAGCKTADKPVPEVEITQGADDLGNESISTAVENAEIAKWMELYFEVMEDKAAETTHITLIDIDFDRIPELFLSQLGASNSAIFQGYSFKEGIITKLQIPDEFMPLELELYKNKKTNERIWIASGMFRDVSSNDYIWNKVDFGDFSHIRESLFWGWNETLNGEGTSSKITYKLMNDKTGDRVVTKEQINESEKEVFSGYEVEDTLSLFSFIESFAREEGSNLDKHLFYSFAQLYETTSKENSRIDETDPMQLPIFSINNVYLFNMLPKDYAISVINKGYSRHDDKSGANIRVDYVQINDLFNRDRQCVMNEKLKKYALSDWNVKAERDLELTIKQSPAIYQDFLSVREWTDYYEMGAAHPWTALSAITLDLKTGGELSLTDVIAVDERIKEKIFAGDFKNGKFTHEECIQFEFYDNLWNVMQGNSQNSFYLTEYSIGFILELPHVMGDYMTFEIPYEDLKEWLCI